MKILYVTTVGGTMKFFVPFIQALLADGHTVDIATNEKSRAVAEVYRQWGCEVYQIDTSRSPLNRGNLKAIQQLKKLVEEEKYDIVHCHTPVAAMCTRLACRKARKQGTKVFYTAHGFHFYKGAPLKNWLLYYPVEWVCAYFTDLLITINKEDFALAQRRLKAKAVAYVPGVGIDLEKFNGSTADKAAKRQELGVPENAKLLLSVGELNENKNHETVIRAIADTDIHYMIAGQGNAEHRLRALISELNMSDRVKLLGFRKDIGELCAAADAFVFPSYREGLSVALMEAMASGLPVVCSRIRGNTDLVDENGGELFDPHSMEECKTAIGKILSRDLAKMGKYNAQRVRDFSLERVNEMMEALYTQYS